MKDEQPATSHFVQNKINFHQDDVWIRFRSASLRKERWRKKSRGDCGIEVVLR